jgi:hypothetical protein
MTSNEGQQGLAAQPGFFPILVAPGRSAEIPGDADVYGFLVGSWALDVRRYAGVDVSRDGIRGEVHAAWVLEGRAVQDVWIVPRRDERAADPAPYEYGTSLRFPDPAAGGWRSTWVGPTQHVVRTFVARRVGDEVVLDGHDEAGRRLRWAFADITDDSFTWSNATWSDAVGDGGAWVVTQRFVARRGAG